MTKKQENSDAVCSVIAIDEEKVKAVTNSLPAKNEIDNLSAIFNILADQQLKIILNLLTLNYFMLVLIL